MSDLHSAPNDQAPDDRLRHLRHDLRNSLSAIVTAARVLRKAGCVPSEHQEVLDIIERHSGLATKNLSALVDEIQQRQESAQEACDPEEATIS